MEHILKINEKEFARVQEGDMRFQVRLNDRNYQGGDIIRFVPIPPADVNNPSPQFPAVKYMVTYVHSGLGMAKGYVVLGIKETLNV